MRDFYILAYDSDRNDLELVTDYEFGDFDPTEFWSGEQFSGTIPESARLWVKKGKPSDYLANPISWNIVSQRMWSLIKPLAANSCQLVPVPLHYERTKDRVQGYILMNVTRCIRAVKNLDGDGDISLQDLWLDATKIPADVHVFRLEESSTVTIVSDAIFTGLRGKDLQGIVLIKTRVK